MSIWSFHPLGLEQALYNLPGPPLSAERPGPLGRCRCRLIARCWLRTWTNTNGDTALDPAVQPPDSRYYGPNRSIFVAVGGMPIPPTRILPMDLAGYDPPPASFPVFISGPIATLEDLPRDPQLTVTIGTTGPLTIALLPGPRSPVPTTVPEAAAALQEAIRTASGQTGFAQVTVLAIGPVLAVVPGDCSRIGRLRPDRGRSKNGVGTNVCRRGPTCSALARAG